MAQRDRGRYLTDVGLARLEEAIAAWEKQNECKCTQEKLKELSGLNETTIARIRKNKKGGDLDPLKRLFTGLGLTLEKADHYIPSQSTTEVMFDRSFLGREKGISDLNNLANQRHKIIVIQAKGGVGKTTLARQYLKTQGFNKVLELWMAKETQNITSVESVVEEWLRRDLDEEPGREFGVTLERLRQKFRDPTLRIGVLIDNLEPALDPSGRFVLEHRRYAELLRVLADSDGRSLTLITSRERLGESSISVEHYVLKGLELATWQSYFESRRIDIDDHALPKIHNAYDGNAKAMEIIAGAILQDCQGDLATYWVENQDELLIAQDLEDLVVGQFERLKEQDSDAYRLLCRMGCYRYQDVPTVPMEGLLCLQWDVHEQEQKRVVKRLQRRLLVEIENGRYWLHPMFKTEARNRLRSDINHWESTNKKAAAFWTDSISKIISLNDAIQAFEAYHHYVAIKDFHAACRVIVYKRESVLERKTGKSISLLKDSLGNSFCRFGLIEKLSLIEKIIQVDEIESSYELGKIHNILGDMYFLMGLAERAIGHHEKVREIARECTIKSLELSSLMNEGICRIELNEMEKAIEILEPIADCKSDHWYDPEEDKYIVISWAALAFAYSSTGRTRKAHEILIKSKEGLSTYELGPQGIGYRLIYMGLAYEKLNSVQDACLMYSQAMDFAEKASCIKVKAEALIGLASVDRSEHQYESSEEKILEVISLLEKTEHKSLLRKAQKLRDSWRM